MDIEKEGEGKGEHAAVFEQDSKRNLPADEKVVAAASPAEEGAISSPSLRSSPNTNSYMITSLQSKDAATSSSQGGIESQRSSSILKSRTTSYNVLTRIGEGTFGEVFKATDAKTGQVVALKRIRIPNAQQQGVPLSLIREIKGLTQLEDPHVIHLFDHFPQGSSVILVLEYMHTDLGQVLARLADQGKSLSEAQIKTIMIMLLKGLAAVHKCNLMHRDLKPANLLLTQKGILKLADFGLVRVVKEKRRKGGGDYTHEVATRWYRAPELLFGSRNYGQGVDLWAVGCIFGELMNHMPLFPGQNDIDQLSVIFESFGTPTDEQWPSMKDLPDFKKISFPVMQPTPPHKLLPSASKTALQLIRRLLAYDPDDRVAAHLALQERYFYSEPWPVHHLKLRGTIAAVQQLAAEKRNAVFEIDAPFNLEGLLG